MKTLNLQWSDETDYKLKKFTDLSCENYANGMSQKEWENARSYAVEVVLSILRDNPNIFDYSKRVDVISKERYENPSR